MTAVNRIVNNYNSSSSSSSSDHRKFQLPQDPAESSYFLTQEERWGASQSSNTSPSCLSDFPSLPDHPAMTPLLRRTSLTLMDPCDDIPSAQNCGGGVGSREQQQQQQQKRLSLLSVPDHERFMVTHRSHGSISDLSTLRRARTKPANTPSRRIKTKSLDRRIFLSVGEEVTMGSL